MGLLIHPQKESSFSPKMTTSVHQKHHAARQGIHRTASPSTNAIYLKIEHLPSVLCDSFKKMLFKGKLQWERWFRSRFWIAKTFLTTLDNCQNLRGSYFWPKIKYCMKWDLYTLGSHSLASTVTTRPPGDLQGFLECLHQFLSWLWNIYSHVWPTTDPAFWGTITSRVIWTTKKLATWSKIILELL